MIQKYCYLNKELKMLYKQLGTNWIKLDVKESIEFNAGEGAILIPPADSKVFLHWLTDKGNVKATFTMICATLVTGKIKVINGSPNHLDIRVINDI